MKKNRILILAAGLACLGAVEVAQSANIASWDFYDFAAKSSGTNNIIASSYSSSFQSAPSIGFQTTGGQSVYSISTPLHLWEVAVPASPRDTLETAITKNRYIQFTLTPVEENQLSVESISVAVSAKYPVWTEYSSLVSVLSSVDGFEVGKELDTQAVVSTDSKMPTVLNFSINQSEIVGPVTYRLYFYGGDTNYFLFGDSDDSSTAAISVTGTVPEPTTAMILLVVFVCGIGACGLSLFRKPRISSIRRR